MSPSPARMVVVPTFAARPSTRPTLTRAERLLVALEAFVAIGAVGGAVALVINGAGMPVEVLRASPFTAWWQAAVTLLLVNAGLPAVAVVAAVRRARWSPWAHVVAAGGLSVWMAVQVATIGLVFGLQVVFGVLAGVMLALSLLHVWAQRRGFGPVR